MAQIERNRTTSGIALRLRSAWLIGGWKIILFAPVWLVCRRFLVIEKNIDEVPEGQAPIHRTWERLSGSALSELALLNPLLRPEEIRRRDDAGQICYACRIEGQIVHYRWYAQWPVYLPFLRLTWEPQPGDYTILDVYTRPDVRSRGIHSMLGQWGAARARELGLKRVVSFIAWWNIPSLRVARAGGVKESGSVTLWNVGFARFHTTSGTVRVQDGRIRIPKE